MNDKSAISKDQIEPEDNYRNFEVSYSHDFLESAIVRAQYPAERKGFIEGVSFTLLLIRIAYLGEVAELSDKELIQVASLINEHTDARVGEIVQEIRELQKEFGSVRDTVSANKASLDWIKGTLSDEKPKIDKIDGLGIRIDKVERKQDNWKSWLPSALAVLGSVGGAILGALIARGH